MQLQQLDQDFDGVVDEDDDNEDDDEFNIPMSKVK